LTLINSTKTYTGRTLTALPQMLTGMDRTLVRMDHERVDNKIFESTGRKKKHRKT